MASGVFLLVVGSGWVVMKRFTSQFITNLLLVFYYILELSSHLLREDNYRVFFYIFVNKYLNLVF